VLQGAGVKIVTGAGGTVADAIAQFNSGELETSTEAVVDGHWV
jgi:predicted Fe-Mo cluster-binding NifX family protein